MKTLSKWLNHQWYTSQHKPLVLQGLSTLYHLGQKFDQKRQGRKAPKTSPLPVIVIGNLTVGGTGKTPFILSLYEKLSEQGLSVGIVTRGYKNKGLSYPYLVQSEDTANIIGDEAALLASKITCPIVIAPKRQEGVDFLATHHLCDIVLSDDGLQHYAMARTLEIVVIDGMRGFGNDELLPLGPLREPLNRLASVDIIIVNGEPNPKLQEQLQAFSSKTYQMECIEQAIYSLQSHTGLSTPLAAFAGIGNPERFFQSLRLKNLAFTPYIFPDHHHYQVKDFEIPESCIIMTEKDAIKCQTLTQKPIFILPIRMNLDAKFWHKLLSYPFLKP
jgi:tetraacyldisaccharide 4'-kinase